MTADSSGKDLLVIDVDTHLTEPWDLWTSRAPSEYKDRVPQVREIDGQNSWTIDDVVLGPARAASVIRQDGTKVLGSRDLFELTIHTSHAGASQVQPRLEKMDELGVWAQIVYPNTVGFGGQRFAEVKDLSLRTLSTTLYNDAMADIQEQSGNRLFPMALLPWWDMDATLAEIERVKQLGLKGLNTNADPHNQDLPDLSQDHWRPMWEAIEDSGLPLNFHIGASVTQMAYFGDAAWPTQSDDVKLALGSSMIFLGNARVLGNFIYSGILERHPNMKIVSVESGIGWIPFALEAFDYQLQETAPSSLKHLSLTPSEYFARQIYACFWFESNAVVNDIERLGVDHCMFETDYPHPTCLYPDSVQRIQKALENVDDTFRRKVLSQNAVDLYHLPLPG